MKIELSQLHKLENSNRQSGRTTRMLVDALNSAMSGRTVYILCTKESIGHTRKLAQNICEYKAISYPEGIKFETIESIGERNIDWFKRSLIHAHPNCQLFIDHFVYTIKYGHILEGYHAYDREGPISFAEMKLDSSKEIKPKIDLEDIEGEFWNQKAWNEFH